MIVSEVLAASSSTFVLIALAEIGDKSQLVCMTLASRHRHWPVIFGAALAFSLLNVLAVVFGAAAATWLPQPVAAAIVAVLFFAFAVHAFWHKDEDDAGDVVDKPGYGIFATTLLLIFLAEFGDKTQIAVAGLAGTLAPLSVWIGATAALIAVSAVGVWAGRTVLQRLPLFWLHRLGAVMFLLFAVLAGARALGYTP